jgi:hypothetical protein
MIKNRKYLQCYFYNIQMISNHLVIDMRNHHLQLVIDDRIHHVVPNELMIIMNDDEQGRFLCLKLIEKNHF